jgi:hypothetical protein
MASHLTQWMSLDEWREHRRTVRRRNFFHLILSDPDDDTPEFTCVDEDPVIVNLTDDERSQIERPI